MTDQAENIPTGESESSPPELITFDEFKIGQNVVENLQGIEGQVVNELAGVFEFDIPEQGWDAQSLGDLVGKVGKDNRFKNNLPSVLEYLPGFDGRQLAIKFIESSGLLVPVRRNFINPEAPVPDRFSKVIITGAMRNWMMRRAEQLIKDIENEITYVDEVVLAGSQRLMNLTEGDDVQEGQTEADYLEKVIKPKLEAVGLSVALLKTDSTKGRDVAKAAAETIQPDDTVAVYSNAGNWVQDAGQLVRAMRGLGTEDALDNVFSISDEISIAQGLEGESSYRYQNPYTALAMIPRALRELYLQQQQASI